VTNPAVEAARAVEVVEADDGKVLRSPVEGPVVHRGDTGRIPRFPVTDEMLLESGRDPRSWLTYGGGYRQHRHTTADRITTGNVGDLELAYSYHTGVEGSMEGTPIVVPGDPPVLYQTQGPDHVRAVDARTGETLWAYTYANAQGVTPVFCCGDNNRGVAVYGNRVYMTTLDAGLVALDRYTGEQAWYHSSAPAERGYSATWAPVVYDGLVLNGSAGGEYGVRGFVEGVDAESGDRAWRTWTTPEDQWVGDSWKHGAATVWMTVTVDPATDTLYAPVGNPGPDVNGTVRPGPNPYSSGVLALDTRSGDVAWYFQQSPHDWWDYDTASPPVVFDADVRGERRRVVSSAAKTGWLYLLDAGDGKLYERSEEVCQHLDTWSLPPRDLNDAPWVMPSSDGGAEWNPTSYHPGTGLVYVKAMNYPGKFVRYADPEWEPRKTYLGGDFGVLPEMEQGGPPPDEWNRTRGVLSAVDPVSGEVAWRDWFDEYTLGGSLTTATGLMFAGNGSGEFVAYDAASGDRLWVHEFDASVNASPVSWFDPGTDTQYVAVQAGGGGLRSHREGDTVGVFALGGELGG
jgi:PQQ-dependent dehydrogenase (methanol/ethanol family)